MSEHTKEPWAAYQDGKCEMNNISHFIKNLEGDLIITYGHLSEADARRIVACVNACKGIGTEALENIARYGSTLNKEIVNRTSFSVVAAQQRDELLAALERLTTAMSKPAHDAERPNALAQASAAIAKVKGGAT